MLLSVKRRQENDWNFAPSCGMNHFLRGLRLIGPNPPYFNEVA